MKKKKPLTKEQFEAAFASNNDEARAKIAAENAAREAARKAQTEDAAKKPAVGKNG